MPWAQIPPEQLFFNFLEKEMSRFIALPCLDLGLTVPVKENKTQNISHNCVYCILRAIFVEY